MGDKPVDSRCRKPGFAGGATPCRTCCLIGHRLLGRWVGALRRHHSKALSDGPAELLLGLPVAVACAVRARDAPPRGERTCRHHQHLRRAEKTMSPSQSIRSRVSATAHEVLPKFGLAFLVDDHETTWAITRNMEGPGLDSLRSGQRVQLTLDHHPGFSVVRAYEPQN